MTQSIILHVKAVASIKIRATLERVTIRMNPAIPLRSKARSELVKKMLRNAAPTPKIRTLQKMAKMKRRIGKLESYTYNIHPE